MAVIIRKLGEHEVNLANDFFNGIYGLDRSLATFQWEFLRGPFGPAIYVIAVDTTTEKVVGIQCAIPIKLLTSAGNEVMTAKSEDTLVDPGYRGQKIFDRLYDLLLEECKLAGINYIWGFTPARRAFEKIGFEVPYSARQALLVIKPKQAFKFLVKLNSSNTAFDRAKIYFLCVLSMVKGQKLRQFSTKLLHFTETPLEGDKSQLFQQLYAGENVTNLLQSSDFLKWRLLDNPYQNDYKSIQVFHDKTLICDAIINVRGPVGYIEQLLFEKVDFVPEAVGLLVKILKRRCALIRGLTFNFNHTLTKQESVLRTCGFFLLERGNFFVWKSLTPEKLLSPVDLFLNRLFTQGNS